MQCLSSINSSNMVGLARNNPSKTAVVFNSSNDWLEIVLQRQQLRLCLRNWPYFPNKQQLHSMALMIGQFFQIIVAPEIA